MKVLLRVVLLFIVCSLIKGSPIENQFHRRNSKDLQPLPERAIAMEKLQYLPDVLRATYFVFGKVGAFAKFMRQYNAIPKISKCLKVIMPRFKTGRKIMKYYSQVKAENEGKGVARQETTTIPRIPAIPILITIPVPHLSLPFYQPSYPFFSLPARSLSGKKMRSDFRRDQMRKYNYYQKRRRRYQRKFNKQLMPPMMGQTPSISELLLAHWEQFASPYLTAPPTTKPATKGLLDLLPDPNQVPYYANMALDVFDTHFDSWNSKIKTIYNSFKNKFLKDGSHSESGSSSEYEGYANDTSSSNSSSSASSESGDSSSDKDSNSSVSSSNSSSSASNSTEQSDYSDSTSGSEEESDSYDSEESSVDGALHHKNNNNTDVDHTNKNHSDDTEKHKIFKSNKGAELPTPKNNRRKLKQLTKSHS